MRISDWSSDVCSSDLSDSSLTDGLLGHGKVIGVSCGAFLCIFGLLGFGGRFRRVASDAKSTDCGEQHGASHAAEEAFILCDHSTSPNFIWAVRAHRDRKRVVWGTSGYVRVDLGGRRYIQKNKKI